MHLALEQSSYGKRNTPAAFIADCYDCVDGTPRSMFLFCWLMRKDENTKTD